MFRLKLFAGLFLLVALSIGGFALWKAVSRIDPAVMARQLSQSVGAALHATPTVYVQKRVVVQEKKAIAELALVSRQTAVDHRMQSERFFSKAGLQMHGSFAVKAGFDLRSRDFSLHFDPEAQKARLELPRPRVLSLEMTDFTIVEDRSGWWNRISEFDREIALRQMKADAKLEAIRAGILEECKRELEKALAGVSRETGVQFEFSYGNQDVNVDLNPEERILLEPGLPESRP